LEIDDASDLLGGSPLDCFKGALPFEENYPRLHIFQTLLDPQTEREIILESGGGSGSAARMRRMADSGSDTANRCHICASADYSRLSGCIGSAPASRIMRDNFMQLLRIAVESFLTYHGYFSLHASCVVYRGKAILFTAPAGTGKSTQARIRSDSLGAKILSGDRPLLQYSNEGVCVHGVPWDGKEQVFIQEKYPVAAIIEVRRAAQNYLRRLGARQAAVLLLKQCFFIPMWDDTAKFLAMDAIRNVAGRFRFTGFSAFPRKARPGLCTRPCLLMKTRM
jgi:hypothetical protein